MSLYDKDYDFKSAFQKFKTKSEAKPQGRKSTRARMPSTKIRDRTFLTSEKGSSFDKHATITEEVKPINIYNEYLRGGAKEEEEENIVKGKSGFKEKVRSIRSDFNQLLG